jgi:hypothetical protein
MDVMSLETALPLGRGWLEKSIELTSVQEYCAIFLNPHGFSILG